MNLAYWSCAVRFECRQSRHPCFILVQLNNYRAGYSVGEIVVPPVNQDGIPLLHRQHAIIPAGGGYCCTVSLPLHIVRNLGFGGNINQSSHLTHPCFVVQQATELSDTEIDTGYDPDVNRNKTGLSGHAPRCPVEDFCVCFERINNTDKIAISVCLNHDWQGFSQHEGPHRSLILSNVPFLNRDKIRPVRRTFPGHPVARIIEYATLEISKALHILARTILRGFFNARLNRVEHVLRGNDFVVTGVNVNCSNRGRLGSPAANRDKTILRRLTIERLKCDSGCSSCVHSAERGYPPLIAVQL
ncbi:Uncharacterised protein [Klebsiella quasipneumoniae]|nr:Uncharacterised protein [Klebsiella quasipneumoniae]